MEPFALSVPGYRLGVHSYKKARRHHDTQQSSRSPSPETDTETETQFSSNSRLPSETINPLSHSPDTLRQLAVAGLSPEDELPSRLYLGFPHKPLRDTSVSSRSGSRRDRKMPKKMPVGFDSGVETDTSQHRQSRADHDEGGRSRKDKGENGNRKHSTRIRHLNTMTAIMHRCLRDGDMARAKRAFGLLVRTKDVDVRIDNLWAIGSEILMRDGEEPLSISTSMPSSNPASQSHPALDTDEDMEERRHEESAKESERNPPPPPQRWGTAANFSQVKTYLETLIQQHPYDVHRPHLTSAVDFWPALFGIEVYNLDAEFRNGLHHVYIEYGFPSSASPSSSRASSPDDYDADRMDLDDEFDSGGRSRKRRHSEEEEEEDEHHHHHHHRDRHNATDALRSETQRGALEIATRMDGVLENAPYTTHPELLRLRGHVSLFIGDLYLPSRLVRRYEAQEANNEKGGGRRRRLISLRDADRPLRTLVRAPEEHVALARRREEQERARAFFRRVLEVKGRLEEWILRFLDPEEDEEAHDEAQ
ncbi:hypothetical protein HD806DRAFT_246374 [Xylariaceae sp. AK1471]|nr:hypothetical protein HD806DRAFT_246374 [Xylariaceae sp. AK1471]